MSRDDDVTYIYVALRFWIILSCGTQPCRFDIFDINPQLGYITIWGISQKRCANLVLLYTNRSLCQTEWVHNFTSCSA
jgi:hypothetical protein